MVFFRHMGEFDQMEEHDDREQAAHGQVLDTHQWHIYSSKSNLKL